MKYSSPAIINFVLFQILWVACILGAAHDLVWPALLLTACFITWQLWPGRRAPGDVALVFICIVIGLVLDTVWIRLGLIRYNAAVPSMLWAPVWIIALWIGLALILNHSLARVRRHMWAGVLFGLIGSPLSYLAGARLGAAELPPDLKLPMLAFGLSWAVVIPLLFYLSSKLAERGKPTTSAQEYLSPGHEDTKINQI